MEETILKKKKEKPDSQTPAKGGDKFQGRAEGVRFSNQKLYSNYNPDKTKKKDPSRR